MYSKHVPLAVDDENSCGKGAASVSVVQRSVQSSRVMRGSAVEGRIREAMMSVVIKSVVKPREVRNEIGRASCRERVS